MTAEVVPLKLPPATALKVIQEIAQDSNNIVIIGHARKRRRQRSITRRQIENCVRKGIITEGPFLNAKGNWQVTLQRQAAGEEIECAVAIEWKHTLIVITAF